MRDFCFLWSYLLYIIDQIFLVPALPYGVNEARPGDHHHEAVSLQPLSTLSASSLQLLHERTMINTELDLDSLDDSSASNPQLQLHFESASVTSSQSGLLHSRTVRNHCS